MCVLPAWGNHCITRYSCTTAIDLCVVAYVYTQCLSGVCVCVCVFSYFSFVFVSAIDSTHAVVATEGGAKSAAEACGGEYVWVCLCLPVLGSVYK